MGHMLDLGCGEVKKSGCIGVDIAKGPNVDIVLDISSGRLPFEDESVSYVFSSHCFEHIRDPTHIFSEIGRVCCDGAKVEIWTPYAWSNSAFIFDHKIAFNEDHYMHMCCWYTSFWKRILGAHFRLNEFQYVVEREALVDLSARNEDLAFAIRYYKGVVREFCARFEVAKRGEFSPKMPIRSWSLDRDGARDVLPSLSVPSEDEVIHAARKYRSRLG
jgi:SAM-dependent methyltransferase